jgi:hypothetical protein
MHVEPKDLEHVLFEMFMQSGCDASSAEFKNRVASVEIVGEDEREVIAALGRLHDMVEAWRQRRH